MPPDRYRPAAVALIRKRNGCLKVAVAGTVAMIEAQGIWAGTTACDAWTLKRSRPGAPGCLCSPQQARR